MTQLSQEARELLAELNKVTDGVKNIADEARAAALKNTDISAAAKKAADDALTQQGELRAALTELSQHVAAMPTAAAAAAPQTLGAQFVNNEATKNYLASVQAGTAPSRSSFAASFEGSGLMNAVTSDAGSAGPLKQPQYVPGVIQPGQQRLTIRDLLMWGATSQAAIQFYREVSSTNGVGIQSTERTALGESDFVFESDSVNVATVGTTLPASEQIFADLPYLQSYIDSRLRYFLKLEEEKQLLLGSGIGQNLKGLYTAATAYTNPGVTVTSENRMDRLRLAILQAELAQFDADGIVLSPVDWAQIELAKTASDKQYLVGNPFGQITPTLWGRPVVASQSMTAGNYLVGAFGMAAQGWDRQQMTVEIGRSGDDFKNVAVTLRAIERLALTIYRPAALIKGSFGSIAS